MHRTLHIVASEQVIKVNEHQRQPWYDQTVRDQHKIVRNHERIWLRYMTNATWKAYTVERNIYNRLLNFRKTQIISERVLDTNRDTKKLYALVNNLTQTASDQNLMPPSESDATLAEEFTDFDQTLYTPSSRHPST